MFSRIWQSMFVSDLRSEKGLCLSPELRNKAEGKGCTGFRLMLREAICSGAFDDSSW